MAQEFDIEEFIRNSQNNSEIAKRLFEIETCILTLTNFRDLFEKLLSLIEDKFGIPYVWLSIIGDSDISHIVRALESSHLLKPRLNLVGHDTFTELVGSEMTPILVNEGLTPYYKLLPRNQKYLFKSLAVAPLSFKDAVIGSLNLGDYSDARFMPHMDTFFLSQLAIKLSICLSNITALERLSCLATRDSATGLLNRRELHERLEEEFSRSLRYETPLSVVLVHCEDIDLLKENEEYFPRDKALRFIADHILDNIRKADSVFCYDSVDFMVLLPGQGTEYAKEVSQRLTASISGDLFSFGDKSLILSLDCGTASTDLASVKTPSDLIIRADRELKRKKKERPVTL